MSYKFTEDSLKDSMNYGMYRLLIDNLLSENKTTGDNQEPQMIEYTRLNVQRMNRNDKTITVDESVSDVIDSEQHWVVISEAWCGDAANTVPVIAKMAEHSGRVKMHIILRDKNNEIMKEYLTNGTRSIPMLIVLDREYNELFFWGPRPAELQKLISDFRSNPGFDSEELKKNIQMWYFNDKSLSTQNEIINLLRKVKNSNDNTDS